MKYLWERLREKGDPSVSFHYWFALRTGNDSAYLCSPTDRKHYIHCWTNNTNSPFYKRLMVRLSKALPCSWLNFPEACMHNWRPALFFRDWDLLKAQGKAMAELPTHISLTTQVCKIYPCVGKSCVSVWQPSHWVMLPLINYWMATNCNMS